MFNVRHAQAMAAYSRWMNRRLYECCGRLSDEQRKRDVGAFFRSIHGTLNHLLLGDQVWLARFQGMPVGVARSDAELHARFAELRRAQELSDEALGRWVDGLTESALASELVYEGGEPRERKAHALWFALAHLFNHQTHHRGQVTTMLFQFGVDPGVTDLALMPEAERPGPPEASPAATSAQARSADTASAPSSRTDTGGAPLRRRPTRR